MKPAAIHGGGGREPPLREPYRHIWSVVRIFDYLLDMYLAAAAWKSF